MGQRKTRENTENKRKQGETIETEENNRDGGKQQGQSEIKEKGNSGIQGKTLGRKESNRKTDDNKRKQYGQRKTS